MIFLNSYVLLDMAVCGTLMGWLVDADSMHKFFQLACETHKVKFQGLCEFKLEQGKIQISSILKNGLHPISIVQWTWIKKQK